MFYIWNIFINQNFHFFGQSTDLIQPKKVLFSKVFFSILKRSSRYVDDSEKSVSLVTKFPLSNFLISLAGLPAYIVFGGTSPLTTEPAPIILFAPILVPFKIIDFSPIQTLSSIDTSLGLAT